jgi:pimeloyl-ACP methyl ester carboxylesterase
VAHYVACSRPDLVRGVFLVDPPLFSEADTGRPGPSAFFPEIRRVLRTAQGRGTTVDQYAATLRSLSPAPGQAGMGDVLSDNVLRGMAQEQLRLDPEVFTAPILRTAFAGLDPAKRVPCAVAVLRADPEKLAAFTAEDERRFRATNPHATVDVVPGAGHVLHADAPQEFSAHLDRFLRGLV